MVISLFPGKIMQRRRSLKTCCRYYGLNWVLLCLCIMFKIFKLPSPYTHTVRELSHSSAFMKARVAERLGEKGQMKKDLCKSSLTLLSLDLILNQCWVKHKRALSKYSARTHCDITQRSVFKVENTTRRNALAYVFLAWRWASVPADNSRC